MKVLGGSALDEEQEQQQGAGSEVNAGTKVWRDLVKAALLGTERKPFATPHTGTPLDDLLNTDAEGEGALLSAAGVLALYNKAGTLAPLDVRPAPEAAEAEEKPVCSDEATVYLARILRGDNRDLLPEWLALCAKAQQRAPNEQLPNLLDQAHRATIWRDDLVAALGKRGLWLAAHNSDWSSVTVGFSDELWQNGAKAARLTVLRELRKSDPNRARELVGAALADETPDTRADMLQTFIVNLSMDDEDFLEQRLDDRSGEVRNAVADLLGRLPESRFVARMIARAEPLLNLKVATKKTLGIKLSSKSTLEVTLPDKPDKAAIRDGVDKSAKPSSYLTEMLWAIPPSHWTARWQTTPAAIIDMAQQTEWAEVLLRAWEEALARYQDLNWASDLYDRTGLRFSNQAQLASVLTAQRREVLALDILKSGSAESLNDAAIREFLFYCQPWSMALSKAVLRRLIEASKPGSNTTFWYDTDLFRRFAQALDPMLGDEITTADLPNRAYSATVTQLELVQDILSFRKGMRQAFR